MEKQVIETWASRNTVEDMQSGRSTTEPHPLIIPRRDKSKMKKLKINHFMILLVIRQSDGIHMSSILPRVGPIITREPSV